MPYMGTQEPRVGMSCITCNCHICMIVLLLHPRLQKALTMQSYLHSRWLEQQIKRVNYRHVVAIWKCDHIAEPDIPSSYNGNGWKLVWDPVAIVV